MRFRRRSTVEAVRWFPRREYDGAFDPSGVEYSATGWMLDGELIQPGDYIVTDDVERYIMTPQDFDDEFIVDEEEVEV